MQQLSHLLRLCSLTLCTQAVFLLDGAVGCHLLLQVLLACSRVDERIILRPYTKMQQSGVAIASVYRRRSCSPMYIEIRTGLLSVDGATLELRLMLLVSITSVYALAFSPSVETLVGDVLAALEALRLAGMADSRRVQGCVPTTVKQGCCGRRLYHYTVVVIMKELCHDRFRCLQASMYTSSTNSSINSSKAPKPNIINVAMNVVDRAPSGRWALGWSRRVPHHLGFRTGSYHPQQRLVCVGAQHKYVASMGEALYGTSCAQFTFCAPLPQTASPTSWACHASKCNHGSHDVTL